MSETNETDDKTSAPKMTLSVRRTVESGHVRQSFSHGRSKSVVVEKKKRRSIGSAPAAQPAVEPMAAALLAKGERSEYSLEIKGQNPPPLLSPLLLSRASQAANQSWFRSPQHIPREIVPLPDKAFLPEHMRTSQGRLIRL